MASTPGMSDVVRRMAGVIADLVAAGTGDSLEWGTGGRRVTGRVETLELSPSRLIATLDPTSSKHGLARSWRIPTEWNQLVDPFRDGARAALAATGAIASSAAAAGAGVWELASMTHLALSSVVGPTWSAASVEITTGAVTLRSPLDPAVHIADVGLVVDLATDDLAGLDAGDSLRTIRVDGDRILARPAGMLGLVEVEVAASVRAGRIRLVPTSLRRGRWALPLPRAAADRLTRWIDPPPMFQVDGVGVARGVVRVSGRLERWVESVGPAALLRLSPRSGR